ncbi:MAG: DEAD/DEAH box helicase [Opitutales bacterium]
MDLRSPKRTYTARALREWFTQLTLDWESRFSAEELEEGRRLYREGEIRSIELGESDAIVHGRFEQEDCYALMNWEEGALRVRSSTQETRRGHSLAAAGLYEIEELVADEVDGLDLDNSPATNGAADHGEAERDSPGSPEAKGNPTNTAASPPANGTTAATDPTATDAASTETAEPTRQLVLRLKLETSGLLLRAFWQPLPGFNGGERPAYGASSVRGEDLAVQERERLIRLTRKAHKAGFRFDADQSVYRMEDLTRLGGFVRQDLPDFEKYFTLEVPDDLYLIDRGVQDVSVEGLLDQGQGDQLRVSWDLRLGDQSLSSEETQRLLQQDGEMVLLPGRGLARLKRPQADVLNDLREIFEQGEPPRYMLFSLFARDAVSIALSDPLRQWRDRLTQAPAQSDGLPELLRDYQRLGASWLRHLSQNHCGALLADEMGLGKTLQVLSLLAAEETLEKPALVVCPASVVPVWLQEMERFFPQMRAQVEVLRSGNDFTHRPEARLWLSSYTQLRRHKHLLPATEFGYAILDEAQTIKNPEAKVSQACIGLKAERRIALTGTPVENRPSDLWTLFRFLMPGLLGTRRRFERALDTDRDAALERLRQQINPFMLRRTKKQVAAELPPKVVMELACPLTDRQRAEYKRLVEEGRTRLGNDVKQAARDNTIGLFTLLTRLRQICCDPGLLPWVETGVEHSGKIGALLTKLDEVVSNGGKAVIFSQFVQLLRRLRPELQTRFPNLPLFELTGKTTDRATPVKQFQRTRSAGLFLVSLRAGGTGITLTAADYVFLMDPWWNPAVEEQAIDRVHRIGQKKSVFVYRLIAHGTLEERIQRLKNEKRALYDRLVEEGRNEDWAGFFASLDELIALAPQGSEPPVAPS